ncbi:MAG TPA: TetR/AcrR family transcriptional regulator [Gemmatimonadales bacterium]|nr:TetR/AcrR family transcriptional regulator [Gemmatimonadales bacterium]HRZ09741.1 TetR/AcrR family transcriptional regulator [Gemmatimonadales bacterium]
MVAAAPQLFEPNRPGSRTTREAVLDAAERLFAERGFEATSLTDVGAAAGVSRGTPGYFFGSKADLYRAVLERCFSEVRSAVRSGRERALASGEPRETVLAGVVSEYFDFITANPNFVRLIEWEALTGGRTLQDVPPHVEAAQEALAALTDEVALDAAHPEEAAQLLLSVIGLCWFPLVHSGTMLRAMGIDAADPSFLQARKRHVIDLVLSGTLGRSQSRLPS